MPNIMLTYRCNLKCPYCFANEFVNKTNTDITISNFEKAVDFLTRQNETEIGLIGGEPLLHPNFHDILQSLILNNKVRGVTIYTNGILLDKYISLLVHPKIRILVNINSPDTIGESNFERIKSALDTLMFDYLMKDRINLGLNLYSDQLDYSFIIELLKSYSLHRLRISLTVPDFSKGTEIHPIQYFKDRKEYILKFLHDMDNITVLPYYDCNKPPYCIWTKDEVEWIEKYISRYPVSESNLLGKCSQCFPVIDILPDLHAVRCFGMSDFLKVDINEFNNLADLASYFVNQIDTHVYRICSSIECTDCYDRKTRHCTAGCIGFKEKELLEINRYYEKISCS